MRWRLQMIEMWMLMLMAVRRERGGLVAQLMLMDCGRGRGRVPVIYKMNQYDNDNNYISMNVDNYYEWYFCIYFLC